MIIGEIRQNNQWEQPEVETFYILQYQTTEVWGSQWGEVPLTVDGWRLTVDGWRLTVDGWRLTVNFSEGRLSREIKAQISENKQTLSKFFQNSLLAQYVNFGSRLTRIKLTNKSLCQRTVSDHG